MMKYYPAEVCTRPTFRTKKFSNLFSDTYQGEVYQTDNGLWSGWCMNLSNIHQSNCRFDFGSRAAAARWVNRLLKEKGVKNVT